MSAVRVRYQTLEIGDVDLHVRSLRDRQQFADAGGAAGRAGISSASWPLFGVVWESGKVLAQLMLGHEIAGLRVLEVGCGIGLASLVLRRRGADITATDQHPEARAFLDANAALNGLARIPFVRSGWHEPHTGLGHFDLIVGSDVLYERDAVALLADFIDRHARPACRVIIVDPGRGLQGRFSRRMRALGHVAAAPEHLRPDPGGPFQGRILRYARG